MKLILKLCIKVLEKILVKDYYYYDYVWLTFFKPSASLNILISSPLIKNKTISKINNSVTTKIDKIQKITYGLIAQLDRAPAF